ncbi:MAG: DedA family protein [Candidatus Sericytochromatia bacterium]|nr:DedA family protein [Candidatus Sericytochromatia bacterium]
MAMESSIFPVPSEIVMPPAAYWAQQGRMNIWLVILAGTAGSWFGSAATYWVAQWAGRPFLARFGKYILINERKIAHAEHWVEQYGNGGIFFARLLPVIRHLISIPAGIFRMPFGTFSLVTIVGAGIWCTVLAFFGAAVIGDQPDLLTNPDAIIHVIKAKLKWFIIAVAMLGVAYAGVMRIKKPQPIDSPAVSTEPKAS